MTRAHPGCLLALLLIPVRTSADSRYLFRQYGDEQGLENQVVTTLCQDRTGFIWVGTENGLYRYDGYRFLAFSEKDGLPHTFITALHETADGTLWVGTLRGLAWKQGGRFVAATDDLLKRQVPIQGIGSDRKQQIYLATMKGLAIGTLPAPQGSLSLRFEPPPRGTSDPFCTSVLVAPDDTIWFGCGKSICRTQGGKVRVWGEEAGVPAERWAALLLDKSGSLWARSSSRLIELKRGTDHFVSHEESVRPVYLSYPCLALDSAGRVFVTSSRGLAINDGAHWRILGKRNGLPLNEISAVLRDREGSIWLGTVGAGLARWLGYGAWDCFTEMEGLPSDQIWAMIREAEGDIWVGTSVGLGHGTAVNGSWQWRSIPLPRVDGVRDLARSKQGGFWIATDMPAVTRYDPRTGTINRFGKVDGQQLSVLEDSSERLWIGTSRGLFRSSLKGHPTRPEELKLPDGAAIRFVHDIAEDKRGDIWVSSYEGLIRISDGRFSRYSHKDGLRSDLLTLMSCSPDGDIWVCYREPKGFTRVRPERDRISLEHFDRSMGLVSDQAYKVNFDVRGRIWAATDQGLMVKEGNRWIALSQADGLIWNDCNSGAFLAEPDGTVWFGTTRGLSRYRPPRFGPPGVPPTVVLTEVWLGKRRMDPEAPTIAALAKSLLVRFSALTYLHETSIQFRYRLQGFDTTWQESAQREVDYASLPAGKYRFEVTARDAFGDWSPIPSALSFQLDPPWHQSTWFRIIAIVLLFLVGTACWQWRIHRFEFARTALERKVEERTEDLTIANEKLRLEIAERERAIREKEALEEQLRQSQKMEAIGKLAGGIAHDFNNLLTAILGYCDLSLTQIAPDNALYRMVKEIERAGLQAASLTRQLLAFGRKQTLQPKPLDLNTLVKDAEMLLARVIGENIELVTHLDRGLGLVHADPGQLQQVILNLVVNARDALPGGGRIAIKTENREVRQPVTVPGGTLAPGTYVVLSVTDNGHGMEKKVQERIFEPFFTTKELGRGTGLGLSTVYGIIQQSGGFIWVESAPGNGASFTICLPRIGPEAERSHSAQNPAADPKVTV
jgi:signal transduction histidine kinase/ligand-binding sensor domain-containing protein